MGRSPFGDGLGDGELGIEGGNLAQVADTDVAHVADAAGVEGLLAADNPQERALAGAIAADNADALAGRDARRCPGQQGPVPVSLGHGFEVDQIAPDWTICRWRIHLMIVPDSSSLLAVARFPGRWGTANKHTDDATEGPEAHAPAVPSMGNGLAVPLDSAAVADLLESMRFSGDIEAGGEFLVDWAGIRTRIPMLPWAPDQLAGTTSHDLPVPDDGYRSEDVEYACLAKALDTSTTTFRAMEVGAGWAPWVVMGVVLAKRRGLDAFGVAVEADATRAAWALQHATDNGLRAQHVAGSVDDVRAQLATLATSGHGDVDVAVVQAAGWHTTTTMQFPVIPDDDMGGAIWTLPGTNVDYRGAHLDHYDVPAIAMRTLLDALLGPGDPSSPDRPKVDLLHVDVQGVEFELLEATAGDVQDVTRYMSIGTHSRLNEGLLQQFFLSRGWGLLIDDPCTAVFTMTHPTLPGFTVQDGTQLWENPFLRPDWSA